MNPCATPKPVRMWATWHPRDGYVDGGTFTEESSAVSYVNKEEKIIPGRFVPDKVRKGVAHKRRKK